ncbi:hypothetical protein KJ853_03280 [Patescibacteria group bacterium]|nr:hypothetical protein [Patescibacteria group bacterium]
MSKYPLVRTIYLYLFALVGLTLLVIGTVRFIDMGLKTFIFTKADEEQRLNYVQPSSPYPIEKFQNIAQSPEMTVTLTESEKITLQIWLVDYENWKKRRDAIDSILSQRQRDASFNLAMIIVGLPLYLFHWRLIKKDAKAKEAVI